MPLTSTTTQINVAGNYTLQYGGSATPKLNGQTSLQIGTGTGKADSEYIAHRSVTAGTPDTFDLNSGVILQPDGSPFSVVAVAAIHVANRSTTATLTVGGGTNAVASIAMVLLPLAEASILCGPGYPVTPGTGDIVQVTASAATNVPYDVHILGRSA